MLIFTFEISGFQILIHNILFLNVYSHLYFQIPEFHSRVIINPILKFAPSQCKFLILGILKL